MRLEDPRVYCEIIRQWSTLHPEFAFLPRKFKIAVAGAPIPTGRRSKFHDIGMLHAPQRTTAKSGFEVILAGGGQGRTPDGRARPCPRVPATEALSDLVSRGDPARLQSSSAAATTSTRRASRSLLHADRHRGLPSPWSTTEWEQIKDSAITTCRLAEIAAHPAPISRRPPTQKLDAVDRTFDDCQKFEDAAFADWVKAQRPRHTSMSGLCDRHRLSQEHETGGIPGDATD